MAKILLDEDFFNMEGTEQEQNYLEELKEFLPKYLDVDFAIFIDERTNQGEYNLYSNRILFEKKLQKMGLIERYERFVPRNDSNYAELGFSEEFIGKIDEIYNNGDEVIIPVCTFKHLKDKKNIDGVAFILNHIYKEVESNIAMFISNGMYVKEENIIKPSKGNPLPNKELCAYYKEVQDEAVKGKNCNEKIAIYRKIGAEVAMRNTYKYDARISSMNGTGTKMRRIYKSGDGRDSVYTSIDVEHGALEICNFKGKHIDEYTYIGDAQGKQDSKHNISVP